MSAPLFSLLIRLPAIAQIAKIARDNNLLLQRNSSPWQVEDELVVRAPMLVNPRKLCPLLRSHFLHRENVICLSNVGISRDKTVYLSAGAVYVGGGAVVVYPLAGSSNQRPTLQSDSESRGKRPR